MATRTVNVIYKETSGYLYAETEGYRVWYTKKDKSLRLKLYGMDSVYYVPKNSSMYKDIMNDYFGVDSNEQT